MNKTLANNLYFLRKINGYTQLSFSEFIGYSDKTISKWENGRSQPSLEDLIKISKIYKIQKIEELFSESLKDKYQGFICDLRYLENKEINLSIKFVNLYYLILENKKKITLEFSEYTYKELNEYLEILLLFDVIFDFKIEMDNSFDLSYVFNENLNQKTLKELIEDKVFKNKMNLKLFMKFSKNLKLSKQCKIIFDYLILNEYKFFTTEEILNSDLISILKKIYPNNKNTESIVRFNLKKMIDKGLIVRIKQGYYVFNYDFISNNPQCENNMILEEYINYHKNEIIFSKKVLLKINKNEYLAIIYIFNYLIELRNSSVIFSFLIIVNDIIVYSFLEDKIEITLDINQKEYLKIYCMED